MCHCWREHTTSPKPMPGATKPAWSRPWERPLLQSTTARCCASPAPESTGGEPAAPRVPKTIGSVNAELRDAPSARPESRRR